MRHTQQKINRARKRGRVMGLANQEKQYNSRLQKALEFGPIRQTKSYLIHEFISINPRTGQVRHLELYHDISNGGGKFNLYIDGRRHGRQWNKTTLTKWLFVQIDNVRVDWS